MSFAGYKMPHPLTEQIVVSLQPIDGQDPTRILSSAVEDLIADVDNLLKQLESQ